MGKTALALQIAVNIASGGGKVVFYTQEMTPGQIFARAACLVAEVALDSVRRNAITHDQRGDLLAALGYLDTLRIEVRRARMAADIRMAARMDKDAAMVIVDGMWLLGTPNLGNRNLELGWTSGQLKAAAMEGNVPVLAVHQLSRANERRGDRRPILADLRESGRLEEDADVVLFLYREDYYDNSADHVMEIWVAKNRLGGPGGRLVRMRWNGPLMRVEPLAQPAPIGFD